MDRRDILRAVAATSAAFALDGCTRKPADNALTDSDVARMLRVLTGDEADPGTVASTRELLASMRFTTAVSPDIQPALMFDPEVDDE